ncbi:GNAT family N-acetyltransferase [Streptomyces chumphonensis]|uniref:GNAT family N-acetyltransferase n=1 Tax=Streptomyces chumphonensis TaxID=1214925 RepID=A0A927EW61_9ACTN|nr:GNAT family N-acetyltransferase [Streptomyces chumphonensis]MBD3930716.1 GNAT family N-acetyltransferase [Streptomyces chumphonensis]
MPELVPPTERVHASFLAAMDELREEGRGGADDASMIGRDIRLYAARWGGPEGFAQYVAGVRAEALETTPRPPGHVPSTTWWWVDGEVYLGRLALRHALNQRLLEWGGHIGYDVRPSARRRGHATAMLRAALPHAAELGIDPVLITCDHDNVASRRVIERCGGVFEDRRAEKLRYWVPTTSRPRPPD